MAIYLAESYRYRQAQLEHHLSIQAAFVASNSLSLLDGVGRDILLLGTELAEGGYSIDAYERHLSDYLALHPEVASLVLLDGEGRRLRHTALPEGQSLPESRVDPALFVPSPASPWLYVIGSTGERLEKLLREQRHQEWRCVAVRRRPKG